MELNDQQKDYLKSLLKEELGKIISRKEEFIIHDLLNKLEQ
jgi:hypothetical protein